MDFIGNFGVAIVDCIDRNGTKYDGSDSLDRDRADSTATIRTDQTLSSFASSEAVWAMGAVSDLSKSNMAGDICDRVTGNFETTESEYHILVWDRVVVDRFRGWIAIATSSGNGDWWGDGGRNESDAPLLPTIANALFSQSLARRAR